MVKSANGMRKMRYLHNIFSQRIFSLLHLHSWFSPNHLWASQNMLEMWQSPSLQRGFFLFGVVSLHAQLPPGGTYLPELHYRKLSVLHFMRVGHLCTHNCLSRWMNACLDHNLVAITVLIKYWQLIEEQRKQKTRPTPHPPAFIN